ncbi:hypothetical protein B0H10DRAFT_1965805 [Mycena sp. CBHHK59/15]|nr:hypothetical protein B0H10DRAFT_1965805 [Mycena sp. CBHHK59/15]
MCTLIELVKAVDCGTSTEHTMDKLYIVQFPWSEHIFLAFKGLDSRLHHLEVLIDTMTVPWLRKQPKKQQCMQDLDGLLMARGEAAALLLLSATKSTSSSFKSEVAATLVDTDTIAKLRPILSEPGEARKAALRTLTKLAENGRMHTLLSANRSLLLVTLRGIISKSDLFAKLWDRLGNTDVAGDDIITLAEVEIPAQLIEVIGLRDTTQKLLTLLENKAPPVRKLSAGILKKIAEDSEIRHLPIAIPSSFARETSVFMISSETVTKLLSILDTGKGVPEVSSLLARVADHVGLDTVIQANVIAKLGGILNKSGPGEVQDVAISTLAKLAKLHVTLRKDASALIAKRLDIATLLTDLAKSDTDACITINKIARHSEDGGNRDWLTRLAVMSPGAIDKLLDILDNEEKNVRDAAISILEIFSGDKEFGACIQEPLKIIRKLVDQLPKGLLDAFTVLAMLSQNLVFRTEVEKDFRLNSGETIKNLINMLGSEQDGHILSLLVEFTKFSPAVIGLFAIARLLDDSNGYNILSLVEYAQYDTSRIEGLLDMLKRTEKGARDVAIGLFAKAKNNGLSAIGKSMNTMSKLLNLIKAPPDVEAQDMSIHIFLKIHEDEGLPALFQEAGLLDQLVTLPQQNDPKVQDLVDKVMIRFVHDAGFRKYLERSNIVNSLLGLSSGMNYALRLFTKITGLLNFLVDFDISSAASKALAMLAKKPDLRTHLVTTSALAKIVDAALTAHAGKDLLHLTHVLIGKGAHI